jgi:8-oxo-dGTP diphosphatase
MPVLPASIGIILSDDQKEVLLVKRADVPIWVLPGGGIEPGEGAETTLIREVKEESGFQVAIVRKCADYFPINRLASTTHLFICKVAGGERELSPESNDVRFFSLSQLSSDFFFLHRRWLEEGLSHSSLIQRNLVETSYWALIKYFIFHPWQVIRFAWTRWIK